jgi:peroxiredoxin Q/BCP
VTRSAPIAQVGDTVPDFELPDQDGELRSLTGFLEKGRVVLFFYPAALSPGCTKESCHFRDLAAEFADAGGQRVGISRDTVDKQRTFAEKHSFDYPLLSDEDGEVAAAFGVKRSIPLLATKRATFVIGTDRTVLAAIASEVNMSKHADLALEALRA